MGVKLFLMQILSFVSINKYDSWSHVRTHTIVQPWCRRKSDILNYNYSTINFAYFCYIYDTSLCTFTVKGKPLWIILYKYKVSHDSVKMIFENSYTVHLLCINLMQFMPRFIRKSSLLLRRFAWRTQRARDWCLARSARDHGKKK